MSINLENPETVVGMVEAAANYVEQMSLALQLRQYDHVAKCIIEARRLLFNATCMIEETRKEQASE